MDVLPRLTEKAVEYISQRAGQAKQGRPFFLYLPLNAPHTPTLPTPEWQGKSGLNAYGDFVMQTDATVGRVLEALDQHGLTDNTLVFFTSDNGCSPHGRFRGAGPARPSSQLPLPRPQSGHLRRRPSHSVPGPLARQGQGRFELATS